MSQAKAWTERTRLLLGDERVDELAACHVLVVGLGGVGGYASELLVRGGIGRLTIVDADTIQPSNINRQLIATHSHIGEPKARVLAERLRDINPEVELEVIEDFLKDENMVELLDRHRYDFVVDAIDSLSPKVYLIALARERGLPIVSSMGAGAKSDPSKIHQADLAHSYNCTLARALRKRLRKLGISRGVPVVCSSVPRICSRVVLPAPLAPTMEMISPASTLRSTPLSTSSEPKCLCMLVACRSMLRGDSG